MATPDSYAAASRSAAAQDPGPIVVLGHQRMQRLVNDVADRMNGQPSAAVEHELETALWGAGFTPQAPEVRYLSVTISSGLVPFRE